MMSKKQEQKFPTNDASDLGSVSDWLNQISHMAQPIRSTTQILVVRGRQYGISALISQGNQWRCWRISAVFSG